MKVLYCDCFSGISGDMFLAAMLDAGLPVDGLAAALDSLGIPEYQGMTFQQVMKGAISAGSVDFELAHTHEHTHAHDHEHESADAQAHHHHHHRSYATIREMISSSPLTQPVKDNALRIFQKIAEAEASVHHQPIDAVHFHEVGAVDSILDVVGAAYALDFFGIEQVYSSPLPLGTGEVMTQHGLLPIPAPATAYLLNEMRAQIKPSAVQKELVTPTGAGILAAFAQFAEPAMRVTAMGCGAGKAELEHPNILRVFIGESAARETAARETEARETCVEISTNIDDMTPEQLGGILARALEAGALDAFFTPIQMKKNRPAVQLTLITKAEDEPALCDLLLTQTTTLGVRVAEMRRQIADRREITLNTEFGEVRAKEKILRGKTVSIHPEYEDCERISRSTNLPILDVYQRILAEVSQFPRKD